MDYILKRICIFLLVPLFGSCASTIRMSPDEYRSLGENDRDKISEYRINLKNGRKHYADEINVNDSTLVIVSDRFYDGRRKDPLISDNLPYSIKLEEIRSIETRAFGTLSASVGKKSTTSDSDGIGAKIYCHTGALAGYETEIPGYNKARYRVLFDLGIKLYNRPESSWEPLRSVGISWNVAFATDDWEARHGIGPKLTWKLSENWSAETMAGIAFSKPSPQFDTGFHASAGILYKNVVSFDMLYQSLPALDAYQNNIGKNIHSVYGGVTLHGKYGTYAALSITALFIVAAVLCVSALGEGLSGLN